MMNKQLTYIFSLLLLLSACAEKEEISAPADVLALEITAEDFQPSDSPGTRMAEAGYVTSFSDGDKIGLFVLKNGEIVDGMNNICCTYAASTGKWTLASGNLFLYDAASSCSYIAYYPYQTGMNGKRTIDEIKSAFAPKADQSNYATGYSVSCLMTATGVVDAGAKKLSFSFAHAMAMLELQFIQKNGTQEDFIMVTQGSTFQASSAGSAYTFNKQSGEKRYRLFLKPKSSFDLNLSFTIAGVDYSYVKTGLTMPDAGKYLHYDLKVNQSTVYLSTGSYVGALGYVSKVRINEQDYAVEKQTNSIYKIVGLGRAAGAAGGISIYINDNTAKAGSEEQLLLTTNQALIDSNTETVTVNLSAGGMEGKGTSEAEPYLVTTPVQLRGVEVGQTNITAINNGIYYYKQTNDIDISTYTTDWQPIKSGKSYDGGGYKIKNLNSTRGGIFRYNGGTIRNTHLESGTITGTSNVGGIVGDNSSEGIYNCSNGANITVSTNNFAGGIAGGGGAGSIEHCKNTGTISSPNNAGGIGGYCYNTKIRYCYNEGEIIGQADDYCGGICATLGAGAIMEYCYNRGTITSTANNKKGCIVGNIGFVGASTCRYCRGEYQSGLELIGTVSTSSSTRTDIQWFKDSWPSYTTDGANGWGSAHWKSFSQGNYPKLLWE